MLRQSVAAPAWPVCVRCEERRRAMMAGVVVGVVAMVIGVVVATATATLGPLLLTLCGAVAAPVFGALAGWGDVVGGSATRDRAAVLLRRPAPGYRASLPPYPGTPTAFARYR